MTEKLYDYDSYLTEFDCVVISCEKTDTGYRTLFDKTAFFPEEGGQSCDKGMVNGIEITRVEIIGDDIYHYSSKPFEVGSTAYGVIDFGSRFRNMQNHTGEHIICGIAHKIHGAQNVGFHLGSDYVTMDLDKSLNRDEIDRIEYLANEAVYKNVPVTAYYPNSDELLNIDYRSKSEIEGKVRIVTVDGYDVCACCAPHVARTGEIGVIKILDFINYKGGVRLNILCGADALKDYDERYKRNVKISNLLSAKQEDVCDAVQRLMEEVSSLKQQLSEKSRIISRMYVDAIDNTDENICIFLESIAHDEMRNIVNGAKGKTKKAAALFCGSDEAGYSYIIGSDSIDLKAAAAAFNEALNGRGGGTSQMIQGSVHSQRQVIENYIKTKM